MSDPGDIEGEIRAVSELLAEKLGARGATLGRALARAKHRLPRRIRRQAARLAEAEPFAAHPKLRATLDEAGLRAAGREVRAHLGAIDPADLRKGWWLGMAGGMAFNLLLFAVILISALRILGHA
ncbi:MAG TPA: hypothetical protein DEA05_08940 [Rhodobacteraceae bacterium]|nr:hypothetical protein [Paracoccaceae bacterium]